MWVSQPLDAGYLNQVASHLVGERDFASFCKKSSAVGGTVRRIESIEVARAEDLVLIAIKGNAFLHNMVRVIVGTMCSMHRNGDPPSRILEILEGRDRIRAGATAPAHGLYLKNVIYEPPLGSMESAFK
jgi:tRNA pseudouridine38-40 synthase